MIERLNDEVDRFEVPGGWVYRTWLLKPSEDHQPSQPHQAGRTRVQMQAVFVPRFASEPSAIQASSQPHPPSVLATATQVVDGSESSPGAWPPTNEAITTLCDTWIARWGHGSAPGDTVRNAVMALKKAKPPAPWDAVLRSFQRYVATVESQYASVHAWRMKWRTHDPEEPEFDHMAAEIADSYDRQGRQRARRSGGGLQQVGQTLKGLPDKTRE